MKFSDQPVRVRFAPSPTGWLHIGGLRTALYNYLFARKHGGTFILRIEDTDQARYVQGAEQDILDALSWAGLAYEEGPRVEGPHRPYYQSERSELYRTYAHELVASGHAYYAFDSHEALEEMKARLRSDDNPSPTYDAVTRMGMVNSITRPKEEVESRLASGEPHVVRLKVPHRETIRFQDLIRGDVSFESSELDDPVLLKTDGLPTYHLANVVDDHLMEITHVIRGEEWLPSTPKHILLYQYLGWTPPAMAHLPLILSPRGGKLSKRIAGQMGIPINVREYRQAGYEPEALVNFLAFLGWNPGNDEELFTLTELGEAFSIERVGSAGVQFNLDKLKWYNEQYLRRKSVDALAQQAERYVHEAGYQPSQAYLRKVVALMQERISFVKDLPTEAAYFFEDPASYDPGTIKKRWKAKAPALLAGLAKQLEELEGELDHEAIDRIVKTLADEAGVGTGQVIHPTRLALSGVGGGPGLYDMMETLGKETCLRRIRNALERLPEPVPSPHA